MNVALVYDRVNKMGGAERVLLALHELFPDAPLFTAVYDSLGAPWTKDMDVRPSFMNKIPFAKRHHEVFPWMTPFAFESFDFDAFDVVISVTSAEAKSIITKPKTLHICYCLTPTRYLWSGFDLYAKNYFFGSSISSFFLKLFAPMLKSWDVIAAFRPDAYIAISNRVKERIERYYHRSVDAVIYPPVDTDMFHPASTKNPGDYYLFVSRLVGYKRPDIVIEACKRLDVPLVVIGSGNERKKLMRHASKKTTFVSDNLTDEKLARYYQDCRAFLFAGDEDFGIVAAEAQSCGKPVIAYKESGIAEIVIDGITGVLYDKQTSESLIKAIQKFENMTIDEEACRKKAMKFSTNRFKEEMQRYIKAQIYQV
ncbi:MAG: glycosyltransferase [Candidatus Gottesmanbacteria bacterium]